MKIIIYPKDNIIYRGTNNCNSKGYWFTNDIKYAKKYKYGNNGCVQVYKVINDLQLINIKTLNIHELSDKNDIKISNNKETIYISLKELYQIIFGIGHKKHPTIKTLQDVYDLENFSEKFKNTQYGKFMKIYYLMKGKKNLNKELIILNI